MFKTLIFHINAAETVEELDQLLSDVDIAYQREKITWKDHELLYKLIIKIRELMA